MRQEKNKWIRHGWKAGKSGAEPQVFARKRGSRWTKYPIFCQNARTARRPDKISCQHSGIL